MSRNSFFKKLKCAIEQFLDPAAVELAEKVHTGVRGGDRKDKADAGASQHQLLQTSPNIR
jgi:hypothetical protein